MPTQELDGNIWTLYRHWNDERVEYWACDDAPANPVENTAWIVKRIRATQNALHPEWDEVPLEFTVDGGTMPYEAFMRLYEEVWE